MGIIIKCQCRFNGYEKYASVICQQWEMWYDFIYNFSVNVELKDAYDFIFTKKISLHSKIPCILTTLVVK